ncbi:LAME_0G14576g1_1 [Lachancea meyersii CBS 8951]|uniref:Spindle pole body component SPC42 n=1 Tax=Lachancea meyersii CBS 8951 TaxID=1266667 RepID=A0A1G4KAG2_9SACH|nr:LAME_0G14576g1_1 [Lachancea meyersii CBS 8951]
MIPSERIIPEEYRVNSQMINKLIKQNKDLTQQLDRKQDEIDRMNVLIGSLRGKLIKYTELNKKLSQQSTNNNNNNNNNNNGAATTTRHQSQESGIPSPTFSPVDVLQVNKTRAKDSTASAARASQLETRISDIYSKLDALTTLMTNSIGESAANLAHSNVGARQAHTRPNSSSTSTDSVLHRSLHAASEDEILTQESAELKSLEGQIDLLKRKLLIKRENELRKLSLNKELLDLMDKLDMSKPTLPTHTTVDTAPHSEATPPHCDQCHKTATSPTAANGRSHTHAPNSSNFKNPPYMSMAQALETPTPAHRSTKSNNDTLW